MTSFTATEAKNRFGELLEAAHRAPVEIDKKGRPVAVLLSFDTYQKMQERLGDRPSETSFAWLRKWRETADQSRSENPTDEEDYKKHLEEKFGR
jgi:prevent-host-death family protein